MPTKRDSKTGSIATTTTIHELVFELSDGMRRANLALLGLVENEEFAHQKNSLREDADKLSEFRGEILAYVLETWQQVEEDESDDLRRIRRAREERELEADLASIAKAQARLKSGTATQITPGSQTKNNAKGEMVQTPLKKATKVGRG